MAKSEIVILSTEDVCSLLGCTTMTVYNYRKGRIVGKSTLPFHTKPRGEERHAVYFIQSEVLKWAKKNSVKTAEEKKNAKT